MEVPRLGVKSELQLPAYTTATATPDLSSVCNLHHSSWQSQILNLLNEARGRTLLPLSHSGNSRKVNCYGIFFLHLVPGLRRSCSDVAHFCIYFLVNAESITL